MAYFFAHISRLVMIQRLRLDTIFGHDRKNNFNGLDHDLLSQKLKKKEKHYCLWTKAMFGISTLFLTDLVKIEPLKKESYKEEAKIRKHVW